MKLVSFSVTGRSSWGIVRDDGVVDLGRWLDGKYPSLRAALAAGALPAVAEEVRKRSAADFRLDQITLLPPIPDPDKIVCLGNNYRAHVLEAGGTLPPFPQLFIRLANTLVGHDSAIVVPSASAELDYEVELAIIIGRAGRHIPRTKAYEHVIGYTCLHDGSVRDYQMKHSLDAGKNFYATGPCGPWIVTADEVPDPGNLGLKTRVNGMELQNGNTNDLIFDIPAIIAYVSTFTPLVPGDIISTGTPHGVGFTRQPPIFLKPGDMVEMEIERIGLLRSPVTAEPEQRQ